MYSPLTVAPETVVDVVAAVYTPVVASYRVPDAHPVDPPPSTLLNIFHAAVLLLNCTDAVTTYLPLPYNKLLANNEDDDMGTGGYWLHAVDWLGMIIAATLPGCDALRKFVFLINVVWLLLKVIEYSCPL